jgi:hypothetical protein
MKRILPTLIMAGVMITATAEARPVSYPTGWTGMFQNNGDRNSAHIHYSPTAKTSIGYKYEHWRDKEYDIHALQMNNLIKRWNKPDSQANVYLKSGLGVVDGKGGALRGESDVAGFTGIATDWEDRRYFASYENRFTYAGDLDDFYQQSARVGIAPYIGDYGDLHTWLMLEVEHNPEADDNFTVTPLVRLFKDTHLVEAGISNHGEVLFNYIYRY